MNRVLLRRAVAEVGSRLTELLASRSNGARRLSDREEAQIGRDLIRDWLVRYRHECVDRGEPRLTIPEEEALGRGLFDHLFGLGDLQRHVDDPTINDICAIGHDVVWLEHADGRRVRAEPIAESEEELVELIRRVAAREGLSEREFSAASPRLSVTLRDGSRLHAIMGVCERPAVTIRRHRLLDADLDDLVVRYRLMTPEIRDLLAAALLAKQSIVISGGTGAGKSTLMRSLVLSTLPEEWRIVTLEDTFELWIHRRHANCVGLEAREANVQGEGAITIRDLFKDALRMSPDVILVGEMRGDEVTVVLNALSTGSAAGSVATVHSRSSLDTFTRLQSLLVQAPERLDAHASAAAIAGAVNLVVHIEASLSRGDGQRRRWIDSVREVRGYEGGTVISNEIVRVDETGRQVAPAALSDELKRRLVDVGYDLASLAWGSMR